ncbi:hypothetical protein [Erwinia amylovora]
MNESEKKRFNDRVCVGQVRISADVYITSGMSESAAEVEIKVPNEDYQKELELYERICDFALLHGEDLQGLFQTRSYYYMSCFIRNTDAFKQVFGEYDALKPLFNHAKGDAAEFLISFPERSNYEAQEPVKDAFLKLIKSHVKTLDEITWHSFENRALTGETEGGGINLITKESFDFEDERDKITTLSREDFVQYTLSSAFEVDYYTTPLFKGAEAIGEIDGFRVFYNSRGFYFYWNEDTEFLLESWLTYPSYPYGWLS